MQPRNADGVDRIEPLSTIPVGKSTQVLSIANVCLAFDPAIDSAADSREIYELPLVREIHAGLTRFTAGPDAALELDLAESFTASDDSSSYTFVLRKELRFSDGSPVSAADVKWSWERALRLSTPWGAARKVLGNIRGADELASDGERVRAEEAVLRLQDPFEDIRVEPRSSLAGVRVIDELTLEIHLNSPEPRFPESVSQPTAFVLKSGNVERWTISWSNDVFPGSSLADLTKIAPNRPLTSEALPVGAGPFKLISYQTDAEIESCAIAPNSFYWDRAPEIGGVIFVPPDLPFERSIESAYVAGLVDYALQLPGHYGGGMTAESKLVASQRPSASEFLALNPIRPPFDDIHVRRALLSSVDLGEVYAPAEVRWPNTIVPHRLVPQYQHCDRSTYVVSSPQEAIEASKYSSNLNTYVVDFWAHEGDYQADYVRNILDQWNRKLGIEYDLPDIGDGDEADRLMKNGELQLRLMVVSPNRPSLDAFFRSLIGVFPNSPIGGDWAKIEAAILAALQETDEAERFRRFLEVECELYDRALVLPMVVDWFDFEINVQPWVHNFELPTYGHSVFKDVRLDETVPHRELPWQ